jgi:hypothetical protein
MLWRSADPGLAGTLHLLWPSRLANARELVMLSRSCDARVQKTARFHHKNTESSQEGLGLLDY